MGLPAPANVTERQEAFVHAFIELGDPHKAARAAGFKGWFARNAAATLMARPNVLLAIVQAARGRLVRSVPLALGSLEHLVEKANSERVRLEAAKALLDRAGLVPPAPSKDDSNTPDKLLHELTQDQLRAFINKYETEAARRARPIGDNASGTPDDDEGSLL